MTESVDTYYPHLREVLDSRFAALSDSELEKLFESAFGEGITPAEYEEFFGGLGKAVGNVARDVGRFAQKAAPVIASGVEGAVRGAAAGRALGGRGAIAGALAGGVGSALQTHGSGAAKDVGNVLSGVVGTAGMLAGQGGLAQGASGLLSMAGQAVGRRSPAAGQLLGLINRPETMQALMSMFQGRNAAVPVGETGTPVPANAFAGLLGALAREAESEAMVWDSAEGVPGYLLNPVGQLVIDPSDPDQRAARLLHLLGRESDEEPHEDREQDEAYGEAEEFDEFDEIDFEHDEDFQDLEELYYRIGA
ncbi:MAG: hypothetical protein ACRDTG_04845 [Pseudonocardiaceae bacterium]